MRIFVPLATLIVAALFAPLLAAQSHFSARSDLVVLNVAVTDSRGAFVSGLPQDAFKVVDEGQPQKIDFFAEQDAPATIGLLIDASGSMLENRDRVIAGVTEFARASHPDDEFLPLTFNEQVTSVLPQGRFTNDPATLRDVLTEALVARGLTAFHDALAEAVEKVGQGRYERKVLIVLSDGGDNASRATLDQVLARARDSNAAIYTVGIYDANDMEKNPGVLKSLARLTGGERFLPQSPGELVQACLRIAREIRSGYTLGYPPPDRDGAFHRIRVEVAPADRRRLNIRTRPGYFAAGRSSQP